MIDDGRMPARAEPPSSPMPIPQSLTAVMDVLESSICASAEAPGRSPQRIRRAHGWIDIVIDTAIRTDTDIHSVFEKDWCVAPPMQA